MRVPLILVTEPEKKPTVSTPRVARQMPMEIRINLSTQQAMLIADITAMRFYMISNLCLVETLHAPGACLFVSTTAVSPAYTAASVYTPRLHLLGWGGVTQFAG